MDNKLIKKLIIGIIAIIILIAIMLGFIIKKEFNKENDNEKNIVYAEEGEGDKGESVNTDRHSVEDKTYYFLVRDCINQYLDGLNKQNEFSNYNSEYNEQEHKEYLYSMLNIEYINSNSITKDNILKKVSLYEKTLEFIPLKMQVIEDENVDRYIAKGLIYRTDNKYVSDLYILVDIDKNNKTFAVYPLNSSYTDIEQIQVQNPKQEITKNLYNKYVKPDVDERYMANQYMNMYKALAIVKPDLAYEMLNEKYKQKRYKTLNEFEAYISQNKDYISKAYLTNFKVNYDKDYIEYLEADQYGNVYIFQENSELNWNIQLDDYTLENEYLKKTYEQASTMEKGIRCADKFFEMINIQDYESAYATLDSGFKENYFKTQASFERYIKNLLFRYNKVEYTEYDDQIPEVHGYKVIITDATKKDTKQIEFNILIKLDENSLFKASFNVN